MNINAKNLYYFIISKLDDFEIAKPNEYSTVLYSKYYYKNNLKSVNIRRPSIADMLLYNLYKNWDEMISIEKIEYWFKLSILFKSVRESQSTIKYRTLIELLKQGV